MATLAVGASYNQFLAVGMTVNIVNNHNVSGKIRFVPQNAELPPPSNSSRSFGPLAGNVTYGPWDMPGTVYIDCDAGSSGTLTYTVNNATAAPGNFTTLAVSSTVSGTGMSNYMAAPPGIGTTTPGIVKTSNLQATYTDSSGTPGNVTNNSPRGRAAFAAAGASVVVTNSLVAATSSVFVQLENADTTLTTILSVVPGAGSFTVTGNAAATATTKFSFLVVN